MSRVRRIATAVLAAAAVVCAVPGAADNLPDRHEQENFIFFAGSDFWRDGAFLHGGVLWAANGLDREGLVFKLMTSGGTYRYRSGALGNAEVTGREFAAHALAGWRFVRKNLVMTIFGGLDIESHDQSPQDPGSSLKGGDTGAVANIELWYEPGANMMIAADASVSSIGPRHGGRLALGRRIFERVYVGPEVQYFRTDDYSQYRIGAHFTGWKTETAEWTAAVGWTKDSDDHSGAYGRLGLNIRR